MIPSSKVPSWSEARRPDTMAENDFRSCYEAEPRIGRFGASLMLSLRGRILDLFLGGRIGKGSLGGPSHLDGRSLGAQHVKDDAAKARLYGLVV